MCGRASPSTVEQRIIVLSLFRKLREKINQLKKQIDPSEMNYMIPHNCKASCWLNKPNSRMKKKTEPN